MSNFHCLTWKINKSNKKKSQINSSMTMNWIKLLAQKKEKENWIKLLNKTPSNICTDKYYEAKE